MRKYRFMAACALLTVCLWGCTPPQEQQPTQEQTVQTIPTNPVEVTLPTEAAVPTEAAETDGIAVETPVGTVYYPDEWEELIHMDTDTEEGCVLTFRAEFEDRQQLLFDLWFHETDGTGAAGAVLGERNWFVGFRVHSFEPDESWSQEETDAVYAMQEAVNVLLSQLPLVSAEDMPAAEPEDVVIETAYVDLRFPGRWADHLAVDQPDEDTVEFCALLPGREAQPLFTVTFGTQDADITQTVTDRTGKEIQIGLTFREPAFDGTWSQEETDIIYGMQEDINYLLDALLED